MPSKDEDAQRSKQVKSHPADEAREKRHGLHLCLFPPELKSSVLSQLDLDLRLSNASA